MLNKNSIYHKHNALVRKQVSFFPWLHLSEKKTFCYSRHGISNSALNEPQGAVDSSYKEYMGNKWAYNMNMPLFNVSTVFLLY